MATYSGIGGQAVIEGVMMKNKSDYAVAVRKPDGEIEIQKKKSNSLRDRYKFFDLPIIRGVVTFVESFTMGMGVLNYSASFYEDEDEKKKDLTEEEKKRILNETQYSEQGERAILFYADEFISKPAFQWIFDASADDIDITDILICAEEMFS